VCHLVPPALLALLDFPLADVREPSALPDLPNRPPLLGVLLEAALEHLERQLALVPVLLGRGLVRVELVWDVPLALDELDAQAQFPFFPDGKAAGDESVEDAAERPDVGGRVDDRNG
jgi:hypothetical protein